MTGFTISRSGPVDWIFDRLPKVTWNLISCAGPEDRCLAIPVWIYARKLVDKQLIVRVDDHFSDFYPKVEASSDEIERKLRALGSGLEYVRGSITDQPSQWIPALQRIAESGSVVLDISGLPKRFFLYATKFFLESEKVKNFVVTYAKPESYPEGQLSGGALTPLAIPGFAREASHAGVSMFFVGVGYVGFNLEDLLKQQQGKQIKFLMPFPPGSPAARRNWNLLRQLHPEARIDTEIRRIHSADAFEVLRWITSTADSFLGSIELIPLGPKPHAIGMALAHLELGARCQITYAQPTVYRPDYSLGVSKRMDHVIDAQVYCLKVNGALVYRN